MYCTEIYEKIQVKFFSKKLKVDLSKTMARAEIRQETVEVHKSVEDDRRLVVQVDVLSVLLCFVLLSDIVIIYLDIITYFLCSYCLRRLLSAL